MSGAGFGVTLSAALSSIIVDGITADALEGFSGGAVVLRCSGSGSQVLRLTSDVDACSAIVMKAVVLTVKTWCVTVMQVLLQGSASTVASNMQVRCQTRGSIAPVLNPHDIDQLL
eukprot:2624351-Rhodomonas_salina.1